MDCNKEIQSIKEQLSQLNSLKSKRVGSLLLKVLTSPIPLLSIFASRSKNFESLGRFLTKVDSSPVPSLSRFILENKYSIGVTSITLRCSSLFSRKLEEHVFTNQSRLARILAVLSLHSSMKILIDLRDSFVSCLDGIDLSFKESTSREILSMFLAKSSILSNFSSTKALKFFRELINSLTLFSKSEGILL